MGLDLDASKLAELAMLADKIKPGESPESTLQSPEVQTLLSEVVAPKEIEEQPQIVAARCPHCHRSFLIDGDRVR